MHLPPSHPSFLRASPSSFPPECHQLQLLSARSCWRVLLSHETLQLERGGWMMSFPSWRVPKTQLGFSQTFFWSYTLNIYIYFFFPPWRGFCPNYGTRHGDGCLDEPPTFPGSHGFHQILVGRGAGSTRTETCVISVFFLLLLLLGRRWRCGARGGGRMRSLSVVLNPLLFLLLFGSCPTAVSLHHHSVRKSEQNLSDWTWFSDLRWI